MDQKLYTNENARPEGLRKFRAAWSAASKEPGKMRDKQMRNKEKKIKK